MMPSRAGLFKRLETLEQRQRAVWVREWQPLQANTDTLTDAEWAAAEDESQWPPELEAWVCLPIDALEQEARWQADVKPPRALYPSAEPDPWNFDAPTHALKPYLSGEVCETYRQWALLLERHAPESPDPARMMLEAAKVRFRAKWARGYAGLWPWNAWDWKPEVAFPTSR